MILLVLLMELYMLYDLQQHGVHLLQTTKRDVLYYYRNTTTQQKVKHGWIVLSVFYICMYSSSMNGYGISPTQALQENAMYTIVFMTLSIFVAPFFEEYTFRYVLYQQIQTKKIATKLFLMAFLFTLFHFNHNHFALFTLGLFLTFVYHKTHRLGYCVALHMVYNVLWLFMGYYL